MKRESPIRFQPKRGYEYQKHAMVFDRVVHLGKSLKLEPQRKTEAQRTLLKLNTTHCIHKSNSRSCECLLKDAEIQ
jgi:hypothetical protein